MAIAVNNYYVIADKSADVIEYRHTKIIHRSNFECVPQFISLEHEFWTHKGASVIRNTNRQLMSNKQGQDQLSVTECISEVRNLKASLTAIALVNVGIHIRDLSTGCFSYYSENMFFEKTFKTYEDCIEYAAAYAAGLSL